MKPYSPGIITLSVGEVSEIFQAERSQMSPKRKIPVTKGIVYVV
jgi:hypothetical protein